MQRVWRVFLACFSKFRQRSVKRSAPRQEHGSLNKILKLTNIAGPLQLRQPLHDSRRDRFDAPLHLLRMLLLEIADEQRNVSFPVPKWRNTDRKDIQPIVQITAK